MPYVQRDKSGEIIGTFANLQPGIAEEFVKEGQDFSINRIRKEAIAQMDRTAENVRLRFVTPGSAQAMVYQRKVQEAETLLLDPSVDPANYPLLTAEVGITGETIQEIGKTVLQKRDQWLGIAATIETIRLKAKIAINQAVSPSEIENIFTDIDWPTAE